MEVNTIKLPKENKEENLWDLGFGNEFLNSTPKVQSAKE